QATLHEGPWLGFVDFLLRVETPGALGDWSYEVADAKLAREAKAAAVLQVCVYSRLLERVQGTRPEQIHLYLGGPDPRRESFRLAHYAAYTRSLDERFLLHLEAAPAAPPVAPEPVELCRICDWRARCQAERREVDHLALVAGIRRDHRRALVENGVTTLAALAELPAEPVPEGLRGTGFERIRAQARVQLQGRQRNQPVHEILPPEETGEGRSVGLAALPAPSPHDWFFDLEGADYAFTHGIEYLFGVSDTDDRYKGEWALTPAAEKEALLHFLERALAHVEAHPDAHIYHFGHYEPTALKRLVGRYGVGTDALDALLRREAFVDLHRIVRQSVRASVERYSLKPLEAFYGFERSVPLAEANPARMRLEYGLALGESGESIAADRPIVEGYNRDDCVSTRALRDWLEGLRTEWESRHGAALPRPVVQEKEDKPDDRAQQVREHMEALLAGVPDDPDAQTPDQRVRWLLAHVLEWHRREDKSAWWEYFHLRTLSDEELIEESRPLAGLEYVGMMAEVDRSLIHRYSFPEQEHRIEEHKPAVDAHTETRTMRTVVAVDEIRRTIDLRIGKPTKSRSVDVQAIRALLPNDIVPADAQRDRLLATAAHLRSGPPALEAWSPASLPLLQAQPPRFEGGRSLPEILPGANTLDRARAAVLALEPGVLPVQGPPGTGKTYTGARMIRALLRAGRRVGVTGPSHKVITNLLDEVCKADADDAATPIEGLQVSTEACTDPRLAAVGGAGDARKAIAARAEAGEPPFNLVAGTAWLWSASGFERAVDVLFIDEAGQFSLANALAVAPAATRLVLLGDPQQLNQPQKGIHPPGTEVSVLEHLAGVDGIVAEQQGLFLGETWRMRPEITAFTSELFYESKLRARADLQEQRVVLADGSEWGGLEVVETPHTGNSRESAEEAEVIAARFERLLRPAGVFIDRQGTQRALTQEDVLVVAPYNAQVARIRERLAAAGFPEARVGTVDKFQGQEAPVAFYSLASSSAEDAPRGMDFLYALDRLNVATSRARCLTVVVASPALFRAECRRPSQMRMVNAFVRFVEMAERR
ncbi:MAG: TM0106 family RecB-like putative nuclease, partial [Gemmatimonadetes bacterium]|nr:TM0106 family RecB-like putative nuclease [Gemmatimonadota bacterium]